MTSNTAEIRVTGWNNGSPSESGAGYGLRISKGDRDTAFSPDWDSIAIDLPNGYCATVKLSEAFWRKCSELRSPEIGRWMLDEGLAPWLARQPPAFRLEQVGAARFRVSRTDETRHDWSKLNHLQLGKYAEHLATMRLIELGLEVSSTEVDDRGIDKVVRYAPGRCLEIQVKSVRGYNLTFSTKKKFGDTDEEIDRRMRSGYCLLFVHFMEDGCEPNVYLIPGYAWLTPNAALVDDTHGDAQYGPNFQLRPSKKNLELLTPWRLTGELVQQIVAALE